LISALRRGRIKTSVTFALISKRGKKRKPLPPVKKKVRQVTAMQGRVEACWGAKRDTIFRLLLGKRRNNNKKIKRKHRA